MTPNMKRKSDEKAVKIQVEMFAFSGSSARYESKWNQKRSGAWSTGPGLLFLTPLEKTRLGMCHAMVRGPNFDEHLSGALRQCAPLKSLAFFATLHAPNVCPFAANFYAGHFGNLLRFKYWLLCASSCAARLQI